MPLQLLRTKRANRTRAERHSSVYHEHLAVPPESDVDSRDWEASAILLGALAAGNGSVDAGALTTAICCTFTVIVAGLPRSACT